MVESLNDLNREEAIDRMLLLKLKHVFEHQGPFTEDEIDLAVITEILDCLADAGFLKKTVEDGEPHYHRIGSWSVEEAVAVIESYVEQEAERLGVEL